jgi:hypothetical protein
VYYSTGRRHLIKSALSDLGVESVPLFSTSINASQYDPGQWSFFSAWMSYLANKWRKRWFISESERVFFGTALERLGSFLECERQPALDALVQLRLDLTTAAGCLDRLLFGIPEWGIIHKVEYYAPPTGKQLYSISEVLRRTG